ncbi:hypothetical protein FH593_08435 [Leptospira interrogans]|uniref:HEAT repeat protein n=2 Tax=Leptospira interrogans serovar Pyrogenes TaxID=280500 RepID=M6ZVG5_LEPIR|nr:hypothetical protein [Leptospira interrogans]EMN29678.1 hypothetical protein LEP1GSC083_2431 [Leptospira interrogans serovar Pyrogenes str. L0374]EMP05790.1 hypothetical protein LEP1GSC124_2775 [Leptospira interrogans serovar Pyrogenes str. 200701872]EKO06977.1 hypothetical protein LEP1GSC077_3993 [Leptospira interrogans str. C10069]EMN64177.1 hypothetical protein LEP1GSC092_3241 [Leptospira interrogans serovar Pyrogenes str. R168]ULG83090.1 hypothetical protein FH594_12085 [Leptospira inte
MALTDIPYYYKIEFPIQSIYSEIQSPNLSVLHDYICSSIFNILTESIPEQDTIRLENIINHLAKTKKDLLLSIVNTKTERSDVRGFAAKLLIKNSYSSDLDEIITRILEDTDSLVRFGVLYGLEEIQDFDRIRKLFITDSNIRIQETALEILENLNGIYTVFQQIAQSV